MALKAAISAGQGPAGPAGLISSTERTLATNDTNRNVIISDGYGIVNGDATAGTCFIIFNPANFPSGPITVTFYKLDTSNYPVIITTDGSTPFYTLAQQGDGVTITCSPSIGLRTPNTVPNQ